jgi:hypothetical protein
MKHTKIIFYVCLVAILFFNFVFAEQIERTATAIKEKSTEKTSSVSATAEPVVEPKNISERSRLPEPALIPVKNAVPTNYILVTDVLDGFGGQKYDGGCNLSVFAGGQSSPIGAGSSTNFKLYAGFVYPTVVLCGDLNESGLVELGDIVYLITYLYKSGPAPGIYQSADVNCSGLVELGDVVYLISYLYKSGPEPIC